LVYVSDDTALTVRLPRRLHTALDRLADHYGIGRAAMVRVLIVEAAEPRGLLPPTVGRTDTGEVDTHDP